MKVEFSSIEVSDLEDTGGRWDKQDPAVRITIGKQVKETKRQKDAGVEASFPDVLDFELPDGTLKQEVLIEVVNVGGNMLSSTKHVGEGSTSIEDILAAPNLETSLTVELTHNKKKKQGILKMKAKIVDHAPPSRANVKKTEVVEGAKNKKQDSAEDNNVATTQGENQVMKKGENRNDKERTEIDKEQETNESTENITPKNDNNDKGKGISKDVDNMRQELLEPFVFDKALLQFTRLTAKELKSVETLGKNDPYIKLAFGKWTGTTDAHKNAGASSEWLISPTDTSMQFEVIPSMIEGNKLEITVMDQNDVFSDSFIGSNIIDLSFLLWDNDFEKEKNFSSRLYSQNGKKDTGSIDLGIKLVKIPIKQDNNAISETPKTEPNDSTKENAKKPAASDQTRNSQAKADSKPEETVPEMPETKSKPESKPEDVNESACKKQPLDFKSATVVITRIEAHKLKNVEMALAGKNDPYLDVTFGEKFTAKTSVLDNAGSEAVWDNLAESKNMSFEISPSELRAQKMKVIAMDKNIAMFNDKLIGEGESYLDELLSCPIGEECQVKFGLSGAKGGIAGEIVVTVRLDDVKSSDKNQVVEESKSMKPSTSPKSDNSDNSDPFVQGTIKIHLIKCTNVKNVEWMGKNDPYAKLSFSGSEWVDATPPLENVDEPVWKDLDMNIEVTAAMVEEDRINIELWDENSVTSDKFIGRGDTGVKRLLQTLDKEMSVDLTMDLLDDKNNKSGEVVMYATLERYVEKESMVSAVCDSFTKGTVRIERIRAKNLLNTEMIGKQDPFVKILLPPHEELKTSFKENGGSIVVWNSLDLKFVEVPRSTVEEKKLEVEVWDHNKLTSNTLIGRGSVALRDAAVVLDKIFELRVDLETKKGSSAGTVVLDVRVSEGVEPKNDDESYELSEGFESGKAHIKKIAVFDAANTEVMGRFAMQDLYVVLSFNEWQSKTLVQKDIGSDAQWENLDMNFDVNSKALKSSHLKVELFDSNVTKDTLIGANDKVSLMKAAASVGNLVEIEVSLSNDASNKPRGRVVLYTEVVDDDAQEKEYNVPESFKEGCIHIQKICGYGLDQKNKKKRIKPSVSVKIGDFEETTDPAEGGNPVWDILNIKAPATRDSLVNNRIQFQVFDKKTLLGTGDASLTRAGALIGQSVDLRIDILDGSSEPFSYIIVTLAVKAELCDAAKSLPSSASIDPIVLPPGFLQGMIYITSIKTYGLKNPDVFGKADPYVEILFDSKLENANCKTPAFTNAGDQVVWDDIKMKIKVSADDILADKKVVVNAWDENSGKDCCTGTGSFSFRKLVKGFGEEVSQSVQLTDKNGKRSGRIVLVSELRESEPEEEKSLPNDFREGILRIVSICTYDLKNVEWVGKQDPYCKVFAGDFFEDKTHEIEDGGSDVVWDYLDMAVPVTSQILTSGEKLRFEAWESNVVKDELIGRGEVSLQKVNTVLENINLTIPLFDNKKESAGRLAVVVRLEHLPPKTIEIAPNFKEGTMRVQRIVAHGLQNKEWFGKADPYVTLSMGSWEYQTNCLTNQGSNVMWECLDMKLIVDLAMLKASDRKQHCITANVMDKNSMRKDSLIGRGEVDITRAFCQLDVEVELVVELFDEKEKPTGRLTLFAVVSDGIEPDESALEVSPDFEFGTLNIEKIKSFELKNTEIVGLQDPFVEIHLGEWSDKTYTKEEGGSDVLWDFLDLHCDVTSEMLHSEKISVVVWDENQFKNTLIGRGECTLVKPGAYVGEQVSIDIKLRDDKDKYSGRLVLFMTLNNEEEEQEGDIPDSFFRGELHVKRINGFSLKNTELIGKQDPYVVLKLGDEMNFKTKVLDNIGANPCWDRLDFKVVLSAATVKMKDVDIEVWDKNTAKDTMIGKGHVSLRRAASFLGRDVELRSKLESAKGKLAGRVSLCAFLKELPPEVVEKDIVLPEGFESGIIHFHKIIAKGLQNKEFAGGKQDPYVKLELADWSSRTKTIDNAGSNPIWSDIEGMFVEVDKGMLKDIKLKATVMDENTLRTHSFLGSGSISLRKLAQKINHTVELSMDLSENGASCGRLQVFATLRQALPDEIEDTIDESLITLKQGTLTIKDVETIEVIGGDSSVIDNMQDQYVVIELRRWQWKSPVLNNVGSSASWKNLSGVVTEVNGDTLKHDTIKLSVFDKNSVTKDVLIGTGTASLRKAGSSPDCDVFIRFRLQDKHTMPVGTAVINAQVNAFKENKSSMGDESLPDMNKLPKFGFIEVSKVSATGVKSKGFFGKKSLYAVLSLGTNMKIETDALDNAGSNPCWETNLSRKIASAQLSRDKIRVAIMQQDKGKGTLLDEGAVTAVPMLANANEWVELSSNFASDFGTFNLKCKYRPANEKEQEEHESLKKAAAADRSSKESQLSSSASAKEKEIESLNNVIKDLEASQKDLLGRLTGMENSISKQLHQELSSERKRLLAALSKQSDAIEGKMKQMNNKKSDEATGPWHGMSMSELQSVALPRNIYSWRTAHVQAWLSFKMDLPQYTQAFHDASVDGTLLLKHVDEEILKDSLGVTIPLHRHKLMAGICSLRDSQDDYESKQEQKKAEAARRAEEEEANAKRLAEMKKQKKRKRKGKKEVLKSSKPATWFGEVREHNDLERVKLERIMREKNEKKSLAKTTHDKQNALWKFEYTGAPPPVLPEDEVWTGPRTNNQNTSEYEKNMTNIFSNELKSTLPAQSGYSGKLRQVPKDSVFDEVLAITRAAMFDVSNRLIEVEMLKDQKDLEINSDLDDDDGTEMNELGAGSVDEVEPPPPFEDIEDDENVDSRLDSGKKESPAVYNNMSETDRLDRMISLKQKTYDRTGLVYDAFVNLKNNDAKWLGSNDKLTRLKFYGGFETILRLKCPWPQFDVLWNRLDSARSGELDKKEFKAFFGDFSEFEASATRGAPASSSDFGNLADIMYELCNAMRSAEFTVHDIFSSFDRNGSGQISVSEFCSLLRVVLGKSVDKKRIFRSFSLIDVDSNRSISCNEVMMLVYNVWRSQMKELADHLASLDPSCDSLLADKITKERDTIKESVKKNFPRQWRDRLERTSGQYSSGPFSNLLEKINVSHSPAMTLGRTTDTGYDSTKQPTPPKAPKLSTTCKAGRNEIMRYKLNASRGAVPTRQGATLQLPRKSNLGADSITTEGSTMHKLHRTEPIGNKAFTLRN